MTFNYLPGSNIIDSVSGNFSKTFTHNANGNILTESKEQFGTSPGATTEFLYNNDGQRIKKSSGSLNIYYHYDLSGNLIAETDETGFLVKAYIYMAGIRIAVIAADGSICYYHNNHLATPEIMTDESGSVVWKADYLPFGKAEIDPASTITNDFRFPGQTFDSETGYHYNWNRYYDPETGRYLTADPIGIQRGTNHLYNYVGGDPLNRIDPTGLLDWNQLNDPDFWYHGFTEGQAPNNYTTWDNWGDWEHDFTNTEGGEPPGVFWLNVKCICKRKRCGKEVDVELNVQVPITQTERQIILGGYAMNETAANFICEEKCKSLNQD